MFWISVMGLFTTHRKIGGAPLNLVNGLQLLGNDITKISATGEGEKWLIFNFF
jgi:hypothetical protein